MPISNDATNAAQVTGLSRSLTWELKRIGKLAAFKACGRTLVARKELERFINEPVA